MTGLLLTLLTFLVAGLCFWAAGEPLRDKKVSVLYGYPSYKKTWLTIYHYRATDRWVFEWDDLFDPGRPKGWGDISKCLMSHDRKSGATQEEFDEAWRRLRQRGLV